MGGEGEGSGVKGGGKWGLSTPLSTPSRHHANTVASINAAKQTVLNEVYVCFFRLMINYRYNVSHDGKIHNLRLFS